MTINNPSLYDSVIAAIMQQRGAWLSDPYSGDYTNQSNIAAAVAEEVDSLIPSISNDGSISQRVLITSITKSVFAGRESRSLIPTDYSQEANIIANMFNTFSGKLTNESVGNITGSIIFEPAGSGIDDSPRYLSTVLNECNRAGGPRDIWWAPGLYTWNSLCNLLQVNKPINNYGHPNAKIKMNLPGVVPGMPIPAGFQIANRGDLLETTSATNFYIGESIMEWDGYASNPSFAVGKIVQIGSEFDYLAYYKIREILGPHTFRMDRPFVSNYLSGSDLRIMDGLCEQFIFHGNKMEISGIAGRAFSFHSSRYCLLEDMIFTDEYGALLHWIGFDIGGYNNIINRCNGNCTGNTLIACNYSLEGNEQSKILKCIGQNAIQHFWSNGGYGCIIDEWEVQGKPTTVPAEKRYGLYITNQSSFSTNGLQILHGRVNCDENIQPIGILDSAITNIRGLIIDDLEIYQKLGPTYNYSAIEANLTLGGQLSGVSISRLRGEIQGLLTADYTAIDINTTTTSSNQVDIADLSIVTTGPYISRLVNARGLATIEQHIQKATGFSTNSASDATARINCVDDRMTQYPTVDELRLLATVAVSNPTTFNVWSLMGGIITVSAGGIDDPYNGTAASALRETNVAGGNFGIYTTNTTVSGRCIQIIIWRSQQGRYCWLADPTDGTPKLRVAPESGLVDLLQGTGFGRSIRLRNNYWLTLVESNVIAATYQLTVISGIFSDFGQHGDPTAGLDLYQACCYQ